MRYIIYVGKRDFERAGYLSEAIDKAKKDRAFFDEEIRVFDTFFNEFIAF